MKREVRGFMKGVTAVFLVVALMVFAEGTNMSVFAAEEAAGAASAGASAGTATSAGITTGTIVAGAVVAAAAVAIVASSGGGGNATVVEPVPGPGAETTAALNDMANLDPALANYVGQLGSLTEEQVVAIGDMFASLDSVETANQLAAFLGNMTLADLQAAATKEEFQSFLSGLNSTLAAKIRAALDTLTSLDQVQLLASILNQVSSAAELAALKSVGATMRDDAAGFIEGANKYMEDKTVTPPNHSITPPTHHSATSHH